MKSHLDLFFTCEGVRFSTEICADQGRIRTLTQRTAHSIDILLFIPAAAGLLSGSLRDQERYVAHVDVANDIDYQKDRAKGVWEKHDNGGQYLQAASTSVPQTLVGTIRVYQLAV
jgi:hypothetical protein